MSHPHPSSFPQPQLQTPVPTMLSYAPKLEIAPPQIPDSHQPPPPLLLLPVQTPAPAPAPAPAPVPVPAPAPAPANPSMQSEQQMQKNRLQEFTHKLNIPLPIYYTVNEGKQHAPKFRSTVIVDGMKFTSQDTFWTRKAAEKGVAELALKHLSERVKVEEFPQDFPLSMEDTMLCKSILNEFSTKMNLEMPTYNTIKVEGLLPVFTSSLVFNGVSYTGDNGKNKKEAEQLAARAVILSLIGDTTMGRMLCDIIKSKVKLHATILKSNNPVSGAPVPMNITQNPEVVDGKDVGVDVAANHAVPIGNAQPKHDFIIQKIENSSEAVNLPAPASQVTKLPIEFVHPSSELCAISGLSSKKRRKNKKKANKRLCTGQLPTPNLPLNQGPPCSVAQ